MSDFTAGLFRKGRRTPAFVRLSSVAGEQGCPGTVGDPRAFAIELCTDESRKRGVDYWRAIHSDLGNRVAHGFEVDD